MKTQKQPFATYIISVLLVSTSLAHAEVVLDGTLGRSGALPGPDYLIGADLGRQHGGNLFHSFSDFNIDLGESATFSGPNSVQNIISRVTGGNPSRFFGTLRSTIPKADFYFLNPYGLMFGEGASLDVQGSFHASTADTLRFGDGGEFNARYPNSSLLTVAPISAFGFLTDTPSAIELKDSWLEVSEGETLSLIGDNLKINQAELYAQFGRINLASVDGIGDVIPKDDDFVVPSLRGDITIQNSQISTSGEGGGAIYIRGGQFVMNNSKITANTLGIKNGKALDIQAEDLLFTKNWWISGDSESVGKGTNIYIQVTNSAIFSGKEDFDEYKGSKAANSCKNGDERVGRSRMMSRACCEAMNAGDAGNILIEAKNIEFTDGAYIIGSTYGSSKGGNITLNADETVAFYGENQDSAMPSTIYLRTHSQNEGAGDSGTLEIRARNIELKDGTQITATTYGNGNSGNVVFNASESINLSGENSKVWNTAILLTSGRYATGNAGNIEMKAQNIRVEDGAYMNVTTYGEGIGGNIILDASEYVIFSGEDSVEKWRSVAFTETISDKKRAGNAGKIEIHAKNIAFKKGGVIYSNTKGTGNAGSISLSADETIIFTGESKGLFEDTVTGEILIPDFYASGIFAATRIDSNGGNGGKINIEATDILLLNGARITTSTASAGKAGNITIRSLGTLFIAGINSNNSSNSKISSSSEVEKAGNAGEITIQANVIELKNSGEISTFASQADGGNITLKTPNLLYLHNSGIYTDVKGGDGSGGNIFIDTPQFTVLNNGTINANTYGGTGGHVRIIAEQFIRTPDSSVTADAISKLGIDGIVEIEAPEIDIAAGLFPLSTDFLDVTKLFKDGCTARTLNTLLLKDIHRLDYKNLLGIPWYKLDRQSLTKSLFGCGS